LRKSEHTPTTDLRRLTPAETVRLLNSTPLGAVLSSAALRAHRDAAGLRIAAAGDGRRVDLPRYVAWLFDRLVAAESAPPAPSAADRYLEAKKKQAERNRAATKAAQDVGPIPDVADWPRRLAAVASLRTFCETYASAAFCWPWSDDHLKAIEILQDVGRNGGMFALAMPRGGGKTTLARWAALWAVLANLVDYVCGISASETRAVRQLLSPVKTVIIENRKLGEDFPEAILPLRRLENSSKRQLQQHVNGHLTHVRWEDDRIVFPSVRPEDLPASFAQRGVKPAAWGAVYSVDGLDGEIRGHQHERPDGTVIRPRMVLLDDPQTRRSARSSLQTDYRLELINGDVRYLAGPGETVAAVALVTKIYESDLADRLMNRDASPDWQSLCTAFLTKFPDNLKLWEEYWDLRRGRGSAGIRDSNRYYKKRRADMDAGASVSWVHAYDRRTELSAIQHAMDLFFANQATFWSEYQNAPRSEQLADAALRPAQVAAKLNGRPKGQVPQAAAHLTGFVDVHDELLFWCVVAWESDLTGCVIDYGTHPRQSLRRFTLRSAQQTLGRATPGRGTDAVIRAGLEGLVAELLRREFPRAGGGVMRIGRLLVDMGYKPEIVEAVKHAVGGETMWLAKGVGIRAAHRPMSEYRRKPGESFGCHWYIPNLSGTREFRHVAADVNYWKSHVHGALAAPPSERGGLTLWGKNANEHELFAEHVAGSETWVETAGRGRKVHEWLLRPGAPDNHWFDCLVGCAVAASMLGAAAPGQETRAVRQRKRYTQADLRRRS